MRAKMAYTLMNLLKKGKIYRDGHTNLFIELSYDDPHFIRYEYHGDGFKGEAHSNKTQLTEKEMFDFIMQQN